MGGQPGFFDVEDRVRRLSDLGDQLDGYGATVDFERFREELEAAIVYSDGARGGRPPYDPVLMFKACPGEGRDPLVIQAQNNLSDERAEFLINDRLSFMRFLGFSLGDRVPDANTIWLLGRAAGARVCGQGAVRALRGDGWQGGLYADGGPTRRGLAGGRAQAAQHRGREGRDQGRAGSGGAEGEAGQAGAEGSGCALDGELLEGQAEGRRHDAGRYRHSRFRLQEPYLDRPTARPDPVLTGERCGGA